MTGTILTNKGIKLIAKILASNLPLTFTRVAVGTGSFPIGYDPDAIIGLNSYKMDGEISETYSEGEEATVIFQVGAQTVEKGFAITEAGLFAQDPDEGEILYSYLDLSDSPEYVYACNDIIQKFVEIEFVTLIGEIKNVTVALSPNALAKRKDFEQLENRLGTMEAYNEETAYRIGSYCLYNNMLYRCTRDTEGTWDEPCWKQTNTIEEIRNLNKGLSNIECPEFDDSGEVEEVKSFTDFLGSIVSGIPLVAFLRNFKAGMKFVLHTGQLVTDCVTNRDDLPVAASQAKVLMDLVAQLNSDIGWWIENGYLASPYDTNVEAIYLYRNGVINPLYPPAESGYATYKKENNRLSVTTTSNSRAILFKVDITRYNMVYAKASCSTTATKHSSNVSVYNLGAIDNLSSTIPLASTNLTTTASNQYTVDVGNLAGEVYVGLQTYAAEGATVAYLEELYIT